MVIESIKTFSLRAVKVKPPITNEVVLVEDGAIRAEEGIFGKATFAIVSTDVEDLALGLGISIITFEQSKGLIFSQCQINFLKKNQSVILTSINLSVANESRLGNLGIDRIVLTRHSRDVGSKGI